MTNPTRITVAFDKTTADTLEKISTESGVSQSEIMRRALKFYSENKVLEDPAIKKKIHSYADMLLSGEHVIVELDHWLMFLRLIESSPKKNNSGRNTVNLHGHTGNNSEPKYTPPKTCLPALKSATFIA